MGLGTFLKSVVNAEAMGDEIIALQERGYPQAARVYPGADPHVLLAQLWLARMAAHGQDPTDKLVQATAFSETMQFACVAPPNNMRALGLYFIYKERPDIIQNYPKFSLEFARLMAPVMNGSIESLYQRFNPHMAARRVHPKCPAAGVIHKLARSEATSSRKHKVRKGAHTAAGVERVAFAGPAEGDGNSSNYEASAATGAIVIASNENVRRNALCLGYIKFTFVHR